MLFRNPLWELLVNALYVCMFKGNNAFSGIIMFNLLHDAEHSFGNQKFFPLGLYAMLYCYGYNYSSAIWNPSRFKMMWQNMRPYPVDRRRLLWPARRSDDYCERIYPDRGRRSHLDLTTIGLQGIQLPVTATLQWSEPRTAGQPTLDRTIFRRPRTSYSTHSRLTATWEKSNSRNGSRGVAWRSNSKALSRLKQPQRLQISSRIRAGDPCSVQLLGPVQIGR